MLAMETIVPGVTYFQGEKKTISKCHAQLCVCVRSVVSSSLPPHGLQTPKLLSVFSRQEY